MITSVLLSEVWLEKGAYSVMCIWHVKICIVSLAPALSPADLSLWLLTEEASDTLQIKTKCQPAVRAFILPATCTLNFCWNKVLYYYFFNLDFV